MRSNPIRNARAMMALSLSALPAAGQTQQWVIQFGTATDDQVNGLTSDGAGGVFACGETQANLGGSYFGSFDAWLARYDSSGNRTWIKQFGTGTWDMAYAVAEAGAGGA